MEPYVSKAHLDIMDGSFVADKTIGIGELKKVDTNLKFQVHLMVLRPEEMVGFWISNPNVLEIIFHIEATNNPDEVIRIIKNGGKKVGVALNPETSADLIESIVSRVDFVQFMTVHPGQYGADLVEGVIGKIDSFHKKYTNVKITVDGAMHPETIRKVVLAGASEIVVGGHIFSEGREISEVIQELKSLSAY